MRAKLATLIACAVCSLFVCSPLLAVPPGDPARWALTGPNTGSVETLVAAPSRPATVYAGLTQGGVYRSTDAGRTWAWAAAGMDRIGSIYHLAVAPSSPETVYAVQGGNILYKTLTGGRTWQRLLQAEQISLGVSQVEVHPRDGKVVYILRQDGSVQRSSDGGASWAALREAPENIGFFRIDPVHPEVLYAGVLNGPLWKSTDEGQTWRQIEGLGSAPSIRSFEIHPKSSQILYLTLWNGGPVLFQSTDGGETWVSLAEDLPDDAFELQGAIVRGARLTLFGTGYVNGNRRLYRSLDGGYSWSEAGTGLRAPLYGISSVIATSGAILAPTTEGVFRSLDGGRSWGLSSRNLKEVRVQGVARGPAPQGGIYATVPKQGIYESAGRQQEDWRPLLTGSKLTESFYGPLAVHPRQPGRLYAGTYDGNFTGIARSADGGATWQISGSVCVFPKEIVTDPGDPDTLYVLGNPRTSSSCQPASGTPPCSLQKSTDGGRTFTCSQKGLPEDFIGLLTVDPHQSNHLLARAGEDLYRSTDGGSSWSLLADFSAPRRLLRALAFDPRDSSRVYAGILGGVGHSTDGGRTWTTATAGLPDDAVLDLEIDPVEPATLYTMTSKSGVFKSTDAGATWAPVGTGLEGLFSETLLLDPLDRSTLYVRTLDAGLMKLTQ